jgi:hypothetical protein
VSTIPTGIASFSGDMTGAAAIFAHPTTGDASGLVVPRLNALLRGEISATETYRNVLEKAAGQGHDQIVEQLRAIQVEHGRASQVIRQRIVELGGEPSDSSGIWGVWAQTVQGTYTLFGGDTGGVRALRDGEEHGLGEYESALNEVDAESIRLIQEQLLPGQRRHLEILDAILEKSAK